MNFEQFKNYMESIERDIMKDPLPQGLEWNDFKVNKYINIPSNM
jgi:hypothetical protein